MTYGYGSRIGRRRSLAGKDPLADDPTVVPQSSIFGFLERLPWKIGGRGARYKPNAANLQENIGKRGQEAEPLIGEEEGEGRSRRHGRNRSGTVGSQSTQNSLSSRGDLFPSDDEDDAREIDDEFAMVLGRRTTGGTSDERSSKKRPAGSRGSTKTASSRDTARSKQGGRSASASSERIDALAETDEVDVPSMADLKREEEAVQRAQDAEVEERRDAARRVAEERGLSSPGRPYPASEHDSKEASFIETSEVSSPMNETHTKTDPSANTSSSPVESNPPDATEISSRHPDQDYGPPPEPI